MKIGMIACSRKAHELMLGLKQKLEHAWPDVKVMERTKCSLLADISMKQSISSCVGEWWHQMDAIVFFAAAGIAVRSIAPYIVHKSSDPAVLVVDEAGCFCISLLSGHMGGGNELASRIAELLAAVPVITTATDREGKFAVDDFARKNHMVIRDWNRAKEIAVRILHGETIEMTTDIETLHAPGNLPEGLLWKESTYIEKAPEDRSEHWVGTHHRNAEKNGEVHGEQCGLPEPDNQAERINGAGILISYTRLQTGQSAATQGFLQLIPRVIAVGIGCRKGTSEEKIEHAVCMCLEEEHVLPDAVFIVSSIDLKKQEQGLLDYCEKKKLPFVTYCAEELKQAEGNFSVSAFVGEVTGVTGVCERSAVLASGGRLLCHKKVYDGVTVALAEKKESVIF